MQRRPVPGPSCWTVRATTARPSPSGGHCSASCSPAMTPRAAGPGRLVRPGSSSARTSPSTCSGCWPTATSTGSRSGGAVPDPRDLRPRHRRAHRLAAGPIHQRHPRGSARAGWSRAAPSVLAGRTRNAEGCQRSGVLRHQAVQAPLEHGARRPGTRTRRHRRRSGHIRDDAATATGTASIWAILPWPGDVLLCQRMSMIWGRRDHRAYGTTILITGIAWFAPRARRRTRTRPQPRRLPDQDLPAQLPGAPGLHRTSPVPLAARHQARARRAGHPGHLGSPPCQPRQIDPTACRNIQDTASCCAARATGTRLLLQTPPAGHPSSNGSRSDCHTWRARPEQPVQARGTRMGHRAPGPACIPPSRLPFVMARQRLYC